MDQDSDYDDNENINGKNQVCMESVKQFVFKQLQNEIKRNAELQSIIDQFKLREGENDNKNKMDIDNVENEVIEKLKKECNEYKEQIELLLNKNSNNNNNSDSIKIQNQTLKKKWKI